MSKQAWVTLATNDSYALGALVLAHSLRRVNSAFPAVVLITPSVSENMRTRLSAVFAEVVTVDVLDSGDAAHLALLARPELGITFTKIHCWMLTQYDKCVFLDADTLVVQNSDELFEREELSAAPDVGWPDCFNSGVFVFRPSETTFDNILQFAKERGSFDGGDQGLLNSFFPTWAQGDMAKHLPFVYNVTSVAFYSYLPALKQFGDGLKIIHFIGNAKPWLQQFNWESRTVGGDAHLQPSLQLWWDIFVDNVHSQLDEAMTGLAGTLARLSVGPVSGQRAALDEHTRRQGWEAGNIDYMGADAFDNIWAKISATLAGDQSAPAPAPQESSSVPPQEPTPVPLQEPTPAPPQEPTPAPRQGPTPAQGSAPVPPSGEDSPSSAHTPVEIAPVEPPAQEVPAPELSASTTEASAPAAAMPPAPAVFPVAVEASVGPAEIRKSAEGATPASERAPEPTNLEAASAEPTTPVPIPIGSETAIPPADKTPSGPVPPATPTFVDHTPAPVEPATPTPIEPSLAPVEPATLTPVVPSPAPVLTATSTPVEPSPSSVVPTTPTPVAAAPSPIEPPSSTPVEPTPASMDPATPTPVEHAPSPVEQGTPTVETPSLVEVPKATAAAAEAVAPATSERVDSQSTSTDSPSLVCTPEKDAVSPKSNEEGAQETRL